MGLYLRTGPGSVPVHLTGTSGPALKVRIKKTQHLPFARPIYHNSPIVVYFSAHLIFPTRKEAASSPLPPFSIRKQRPNLPSREGTGVCHVRALPPKTQSSHPKPRNTSSPNSSKNISTHPAPLTITHPSIPSQEGKHTHSNHSLPTRKQRQNLPYREGQGVCHVRAQPPQTQSNYPKPRNTTSPNSSKNISTHAAPLTVTHPTIPSLEGNPTRHQTSHYQQENSIPNLPSREGQGVCDVRAQPPKNKRGHPKPRNATSPNSSKNISPHTAPLTITHPFIPSQEGKPTL